MPPSVPGYPGGNHSDGHRNAFSKAWRNLSIRCWDFFEIQKPEPDTASRRCPGSGPRTRREDRALAHRLDEFRPAIPRSGWSPPVGYQTDRSGQTGKELTVWMASRTSAAKTAGSMVLVKPDHQCGPGPRAQYSDDRTASGEAGMISIGRLPFARPGPTRWASEEQRSCLPNERQLQLQHCLL